MSNKPTTRTGRLKQQELQQQEVLRAKQRKEEQEKTQSQLLIQKIRDALTEDD